MNIIINILFPLSVSTLKLCFKVALIFPFLMKSKASWKLYNLQLSVSTLSHCNRGKYVFIVLLIYLSYVSDVFIVFCL